MWVKGSTDILGTGNHAECSFPPLIERWVPYFQFNDYSPCSFQDVRYDGSPFLFTVNYIIEIIEIIPSIEPREDV